MKKINIYILLSCVLINILLKPFPILAQTIVSESLDSTETFSTQMENISENTSETPIEVLSETTTSLDYDKSINITSSITPDSTSAETINEDNTLNNNNRDITISKNNLNIDTDYYRDASIFKGFLDKIINEETIGGLERWNKFQIAVTNGFVNYTQGMSFNEYFLANNISPEDSFKLYVKSGNAGDQPIVLPSGAFLTGDINTKGRIDTNGRVVDYITYPGPYTDRSAYWGDKNLESPIMFSRLIVGDINKIFNQTSDYKFPNQIGYGETGSVNDYMLTPENNISIPTRYNTERDDVHLLMRSAGFFGNSIKDARTFLEVTSSGEKVSGRENPLFYLTTDSKILVTPFAYDQFGFTGKFLFSSNASNIEKTAKDIPVNNFANVFNEGIKSFQKLSSVNDIKGGVGGLVKITGFYRQGEEINYNLGEDLRKNQSKNISDVTYYMYTDTSPAGATISTPLAPNGKNLYSPNVSTFTIETTRPYFENYGDLNAEIEYNENDFDNTLGADSFLLSDNGYDRKGNKIPIKNENLKIRVFKDGTEIDSNKAYSLEELRTVLDSKEINGNLELVYTYAAPDSDIEGIGNDNKSIVGLLPSEIENNSGAYALPIVRKIFNPSAILETTTEATTETTTETTTEETTETTTEATTEATTETTTEATTETTTEATTEATTETTTETTTEETDDTPIVTTIENNKNPLPSTGESKNKIILMLSIFLLALGYFILNRSKKYN